MIRQVLRAASFKRDAFVRAVLSPNAVADGAVIVAVVYLILGLVIVSSSNLFLKGLFILNGLFAWVIGALAIYGIGKYLLDGYGSFPGVAGVTALAHPALLLILVARLAMGTSLARFVGSLLFLAIMVAGTRVALELRPEQALVAAGGGYLVWLILVLF